MNNIPIGSRITVRGEDFLVNESKPYNEKHSIIEVEGISELVRGKRFSFDTFWDKNIEILHPINTKLEADVESGYQKTKLFLETQLRNATTTSPKITIAQKAAFNHAAYQWTPTLKALELPRPRMLIADGVGLGKTVEVGIFLAEMMKRGKGDRILVLALKSILGQFQQEIWNRFAIPLVRLDSVGIARIKSHLPANKNPFDYYNKVIISIDTLKNNAKFRHYIEKSRWDVVVIDECHTVANADSQRGNLAQFLADRCEALVLTSATPHNGRKESFANLISMIEPTAIPRSGNYGKAEVERYYVRRFKNDIEDEEVRSNFQEREVIRLSAPLFPEEEVFLQFQQNLKVKALQQPKSGKQRNDLLFSIGLFKAYMSSPEAALRTLSNRIGKLAAKTELTEGQQDNYEEFKEGVELLNTIIERKADSKFRCLSNELKKLKWKGSKRDERMVIFAERIDTLKALKQKLQLAYSLNDEQVIVFHGGLTDTEQQDLIEDFGKADSQIRVLLTSDAGAQGVNLHYYCHRMFNYDIPWSLITLEQRNGRIDRYGQTQTPYIYYLVAESKLEGLKTDLYIIDKLTQKEEEVYETLGDAGSVMHLYDSKKENDFTTKAMMEGNLDFMESKTVVADEEEEFDFNALFEDDEETTDAVVTDIPIDTNVSFYETDFDFYKALVYYLKSQNSIAHNQVEIMADGLLEVLNTKELNDILYDLPKEAKPKLKETYQLSVDPNTVQKAIEEARKKKGQWAQFQILYDLHPIAKNLMSKLEATVPKGVALVAKTRNIPTDTRFYIFQGQVSNNLGQSVMSEFFVVGLDDEGGLTEKPMALKPFLQKYQLTEQLYTEAISPEQLASMQTTLENAIDYGQQFYMDQKQQVLQMKMEEKAKDYQAHLENWQQASKAQMELQFKDKLETVSLQRKKAENTRQIDTILNEQSQFFKDQTSLNNEAYLKLLAVFFN